jgi:choline kinase
MFKIIIMCGGVYDNFKEHKALSMVNGEKLIERTIRLLLEQGMYENVYISSNDDRFKEYGKVLKHKNTYKFENGKSIGYWIDAYYPTNEPVIYLHGDVYYTREAINKILNYETKVNIMIGNKWALNDNHDKVGEPFGWIIVDQEKFRNAINECKKLQDEGKIERGYAISWELYEVLNGYDINDFIIDKKTYLVIDDETDDIDYPEQIEILNKKVRR